jgi:hypothetical protein
MAIIYTTGTINQPDSGSLGQAMVERFRDDLVAHPAWDLVEEFTPAGGVVRWYVFKCLAAVSGLPSDFYLVVGRTLANGKLAFTVCESYTAASHTMQFAPPIGYNSMFNYDALGRLATNMVLAGVEFGNMPAPSPTNVTWTPSGTSTKWWICAADDGFTIAMNGAANAFIHGGAYTPLTPLGLDFPIMICGSSISQGGITRNPAVPNINTYGAALNFNGPGSSSFSQNYQLGFGGADLRYNDKLQGGSRPVAEVAMQIMTWNTGDQATYGWALGKANRMRATSGNVPAGMAFGDAYVLQNRLWVPYQPSDGRMFDTGVASS